MLAWESASGLSQRLGLVKGRGRADVVRNAMPFALIVAHG